MAGDWNSEPPAGAPMVDVPWLGPFAVPGGGYRSRMSTDVRGELMR